MSQYPIRSAVLQIEPNQNPKERQEGVESALSPLIDSRTDHHLFFRCRQRARGSRVLDLRRAFSTAVTVCVPTGPDIWARGEKCNSAPLIATDCDLPQTRVLFATSARSAPRPNSIKLARLSIHDPQSHAGHALRRHALIPRGPREPKSVSRYLAPSRFAPMNVNTVFVNPSVQIIRRPRD